MGYYESKLVKAAAILAACAAAVPAATYALIPENREILLLAAAVGAIAGVALFYIIARGELKKIAHATRMLAASGEAKERSLALFKNTEFSPLVELMNQSTENNNEAYYQLFLIANQPMIIYQQDEAVLDINHSFEAYTGWSRTKNGVKQKLRLTDFMSKAAADELISEDDSAARVEWKCLPDGEKPAVIMAKMVRSEDNDQKIRCGILYP